MRQAIKRGGWVGWGQHYFEHTLHSTNHSSGTALLWVPAKRAGFPLPAEEGGGGDFAPQGTPTVGPGHTRVESAEV